MTIITKDHDPKLNGPSIMANNTLVLLGWRDEIPWLPTDEQVVEIPWFYARSRGTRPPYGTGGKPLRPRGPMRPSFFKKLQACIQDLWSASSLFLMPPGYMLRKVVVASVWRPLSKKEKKRKAEGKRIINRHNQGRAIDIDSFWWDEIGTGFSTGLVANTYNYKTHRFIAVEAILRLHFGTVLSWLYNAQHHCHWHLDDGTKPVLRQIDLNGKKHQRILFLQAALRHIYCMDVDIDGQWGTETANAWTVAMKGAWPIEGWRDFLIDIVKRYGAMVRRGK